MPLPLDYLRPTMWKIRFWMKLTCAGRQGVPTPGAVIPTTQIVISWETSVRVFKFIAKFFASVPAEGITIYIFMQLLDVCGVINIFSVPVKCFNIWSCAQVNQLRLLTEDLWVMECLVYFPCLLYDNHIGGRCIVQKIKKMILETPSMLNFLWNSLWHVLGISWSHFQ